MKEALTKKLGPLPRWAWGAIVLTLLIFLYLRHRSQQSQDNAQNATDPYSSYNSQGQVAGAGYPYDSSAVGGTYPLGGGLGSGFDPTSFQEGLTYGQGFGTSNNSGNQSDGSVPTGGDTGSGDAVPPAQGDTQITVNIPDGSGSTGPGGGRAGSRRKQPTKKNKGHNPQTGKHTSTGGGQHNRHPGQHTKPPKQGTHKPGSNGKLTGGGSQHPGRTHAKPSPSPAVHTPPPQQRVTARSNPPRPAGGVAPPTAHVPPRRGRR